MSKYHERIAAVSAAARDWTTDEGIVAGLQDELKLKGYGTEFQVWRAGVPIDEEEARQAIVNEVTTSPVVDGYQRSIQKTMLEDREFFDDYVVTAEAEGTELIFEHGGFRHPVRLGELELVVGQKALEKRRKNRTRTEEKAEDRELKLREKLDDTLDVDEGFYLIHANQCGYLVRNTTVRFNASAKDQYGTSTMTHIAGITLVDLHEFIDSAGNETLSMISTHMDPDLVKTTEPGKDSAKGGVTAMHSDFAKEIIDFLNLEYLVEIDDIKSSVLESKSDSKFQSIERWGADRETVLGRLIERRGKVDSAKIEEQFEEGYGSKPGSWSKAAAGGPGTAEPT